MRCYHRAPLALAMIAVVAASAESAFAQSITGSATIASSYVSRGVTTSSRPVVQPGLAATLGRGGFDLTLSAWGNLEPFKIEDTDQIREGCGCRSAEWSEVDLTVEAGRKVGASGHAAVGVLQYLYPSVGGTLSPANNTTEIYVALTTGERTQGGLTVWQDVGKVRGDYAEATLTRSVRAGTVEGHLGAAAGYSRGEGPNADRPDEGSNYAADGVTHVQASADLTFAVGRLNLTPSATAVYAFDDVARLRTAASSRRPKFMIALTASFGD